MKEKLLYQGTILGLIFFVIGMFVYVEGVETTLYFITVPAIIILIGYLSSKFLPELWGSIIMAGSIVFVFHFFVQSWLVTIMWICFFGFHIFAEYIFKNEKWLKLMRKVVSILFVGMLFYLGVLK